ncbi:methyltransferase [Bordetella sp. H567]|uniref:class I SAM-dependent methyltransferase n=1 Tax=Bordetella sp. H567 TaxID=1697043 RepID=UPI00081CDDA9|nr:class I SAM-dependent methyltransferase [Bordetella sp. H567]AOB33093.1 methyltransferase [Bordetella sp. H567]
MTNTIEGFNPLDFKTLAGLEEGNFWFRVRNELIVWALKKYRPQIGTYLEVGCGTGFVLSGVAKAFPQASLHGSELHTEGLRFAAQRVPAAKFMQLDARRIPFRAEFDAVGAFDVLEHIKEDEIVLDQLRMSLKSGGALFLTVPQHPSLWSVTDTRAYHERRYTADELHGKLKRAGFRIVRSTSFVSLLLPVMYASRKKPTTAAHENFDPAAELKLSAPLNSTLEWILKIELLGIQAGLNYPVGGSRLVVAESLT